MKWKGFDLADGNVLLLEGDRVYLANKRIAPDGEYKRSKGNGTVVVSGGRATSATGSPVADAAPIGVG